MCLYYTITIRTRRWSYLEAYSYRLPLCKVTSSTLAQIELVHAKTNNQQPFQASPSPKAPSSPYSFLFSKSICFVSFCIVQRVCIVIIVKS